MALAYKIKCEDCGQQAIVYVRTGQSGPASTCRACDVARFAAIKKQALDTQAALPLEDRLRAIEEFIYDHRQVQHGYIPEPRF